MIPVLDLKKQLAAIRPEIGRAIKKVIDNTNFVWGSEVAEFEKEAALYTGVKYALGVSNGTDAIRISLAALGMGYSDRIICPAFTYYATAGAIASIGAIPVFVDIDPATYNISISGLEEKLKNNKKGKVKAVIPVHLYGQCADMDGVMKIARKYGIKVVEDTAQAFGAEYLFAGAEGKSKKAGSIGDCGAVSFFPGKNLGAFGDAGMVLTNKGNVAEKIKIYRNQGNRGNEKYRHVAIGFNHRLDAIQAAVLKVRIKYLDKWNERRRAIASYYDRSLKDLNLTPPFLADYSTHIYHQYVIRLPFKSSGLINHLRKKGIDARVYYPIPLHLQKCFKDLGYRKGDFPESEKASRNTLAIPVYPGLTRREQGFIMASIKEYFK